jgi:hypothetical protein
MTQDEEIEFERLKIARDSLLLTVANLRGQIETLNAMYEVASKQRDVLMDEQRAQIAIIRGRMQ